MLYYFQSFKGVINILKHFQDSLCIKCISIGKRENQVIPLFINMESFKYMVDNKYHALQKELFYSWGKLLHLENVNCEKESHKIKKHWWH